MGILTVCKLTKKYNSYTVVDKISFQLEANKCIALIGPNGAGKTTTLRMLAGLIKPTSGTINFLNTGQKDFRSFIGYLPQHPVFYNWMSGLEYLIYCAKLTLIDKKEAKSRAEELLEKVGLKDAKNKQIGNYSGGMKQRLGIAQAIIHQPKLVILDEPVSALDPIGRREVLTLMEELKKEMTILFSTHILNDADEISDELLLLHDGKIVEAGSMELLRKKYQTAKIELEFDDSAEKYENSLKGLNSVNATYIKKRALHVTVSDMDIARMEILKTATENGWPLTNFTVNRASLEDMFMKAVN